ncbi:MAG TPA: hypothetical protein VN523_16690 [Hyphomicrobiaceae bacterium]|jgi:hypothetical protein|nr:hypothetical protein [Hyphomicrobiaceae bacterium]
MQFTSQLEQGDWYIVASWLCVVLTLILYGIGVAFAKFRHAAALARAKRITARAAARPVRAQPSRRAEIATPANAIRPPAAGHWSAVAAIVETGLRQAEAMSACHAAAGRQIDAAEYALHRLLADCSKVMRRPHVEPAALPQSPRLPLPATIAEPLAA